jgi:hypothetical protein
MMQRRESQMSPVEDMTTLPAASCNQFLKKPARMSTLNAMRLHNEGSVQTNATPCMDQMVKMVVTITVAEHAQIFARTTHGRRR